MKKFTDLFPVPKFMRMRPAGLSLCGNTARAVVLLEKGRHLALGPFGKRALPAGCIVNGSVSDAAGLADVLRVMRQELRLHSVNLSIPDDNAYVFTVALPDKIENARDAVELRLEENVPLKAEETLFDYMLIPAAAPEQRMASVLTIPKKNAEGYLAAAEAAGLFPVGLSVAADTARRSVIPEGDRRTVVLGNIGEHRASLSIVSHGILRFTLSATNEDLAGEAAKLSEYWRSHKLDAGTEEVESLILCGAGAAKPGLAEELADTLNLPVSLGNVWQNAFQFEKIIPAMPRKKSLAYASAAGAALM